MYLAVTLTLNSVTLIIYNIDNKKLYIPKHIFINKLKMDVGEKDYVKK